MAESDDTGGPQPSERTQLVLRRGRVGIIGLGVTAGLIGLVDGLSGMLVGAVVLGIGLVTPAPVAFGIGVAGLLMSSGLSPVVTALSGVALFSVLLDHDDAPLGDSQFLIRVVIAASGLLLGTGLLLSVWSLQAVTVAVSCVVAFCVYLIHRYERVTLGLVPDQQ